MMPKSSEIEGLLSRLEAATGPDRKLDADLIRVLAPGATVGTYIMDDSGDIVFHAQSLGIPNKMPAPAYTASVDAALALVERVLTGPEEPTFSLDHASFGANWTCEFHWFINPAWHSRADMPTAPLAILIALLRALSARPRP